jgi:chromosome segregation ATPase
MTSFVNINFNGITSNLTSNAVATSKKYIAKMGQYLAGLDGSEHERKLAEYDLHRTVDALNSQIEELNRINLLCSENSSKELKSMGQRNHELQSENEILHNEVSQLTDSLDLIQNNLSKYVNEAKSRQDDLQSCNSKVAKIEQRYNECMSKNGELLKQMSAVIKSRDEALDEEEKLRGEVQDLTAEFDKILKMIKKNNEGKMNSEQVDDLINQISELNDTLSATNTALLKCHHRSSELEIELQNLRSNVSEHHDSVSQAQNSAKAFRQQILALQVSNQQLQENMKHLEEVKDAKIETLASELKSTNNLLTRFKNHCDKETADATLKLFEFLKPHLTKQLVEPEHQYETLNELLNEEDEE